jgi:hypothetical protein
VKVAMRASASKPRDAWSIDEERPSAKSRVNVTCTVDSPVAAPRAVRQALVRKVTSSGSRRGTSATRKRQVRSPSGSLR